MQCAKTKKLLSDYFDGLLSPRKTARVEEHLRECSDCATFLGEMRKMSAMLRKAGHVEVTEEYWDNYWDRLAAKLPSSPTPVSLPSRLTGAFIGFLRRPMPAMYTMLTALLVAAIVFFSYPYLGNRERFTATQQLGITETEGIGRGMVAPEDEVASAFQYNRDKLLKQNAPAKPRMATSQKVGFSAGAMEEGDKMSELDADRKTVARETNQSMVSPSIEQGEKATKKSEGMSRDNVITSKARQSKGTLAPQRGGGVSETPNSIIQGGHDAFSKPTSLAEGLDSRDSQDGELKGDVALKNNSEFRIPKRSPFEKGVRGISELQSGWIIRVLKLTSSDGKPKTPNFIANIPKGDDLDNIFLPALKAANPTVNFEFMLSSKIVTVADQPIAITFRNSTIDYMIQMKLNVESIDVRRETVHVKAKPSGGRRKAEGGRRKAEVKRTNPKRSPFEKGVRGISEIRNPKSAGMRAPLRARARANGLSSRASLEAAATAETLTYSTSYSAPQALLKAQSTGVAHSTSPQIGETTVFDMPEATFDKDNFIVLITRFKP